MKKLLCVALAALFVSIGSLHAEQYPLGTFGSSGDAVVALAEALSDLHGCNINPDKLNNKDFFDSNLIFDFQKACDYFSAKIDRTLSIYSPKENVLAADIENFIKEMVASETEYCLVMKCKSDENLAVEYLGCGCEFYELNGKKYVRATPVSLFDRNVGIGTSGYEAGRLLIENSLYVPLDSIVFIMSICKNGQLREEITGVKGE